MKLAAGEPPARRGYPASVFDSLPRLLERPGPTLKGSITAFYTVLLEGEDESDHWVMKFAQSLMAISI